MHLLVLTFLLMFCYCSTATTWTRTEVNDPILKGEKCTVHQPASYGGYIYHWPSKYDQVYWPDTTKNGLWFCQKSGFTALIGDFNGISNPEIELIRAYLRDNAPKDDSIQSKLVLLEGVYALRKTDDSFDNMLLRILARWYQSLGNLDKANNYRKKALDGIVLALQKDLEKIQKIEYLYLAANYSRQFGMNKASDDYLRNLASAIEDFENTDESGYASYIKKLSMDTQYIKAGGVLDPEIPE